MPAGRCPQCMHVPLGQVRGPCPKLRVRLSSVRNIGIINKISNRGPGGRLITELILANLIL
jgi:hypothetical protein